MIHRFLTSGRAVLAVFLAFIGISHAAPITFTLNATVVATSLEGSAGGYMGPPPLTWIPFTLETAMPGDSISVALTLNLDDDPDFFSHENAHLSDGGDCLSKVTVYDADGGFMGWDFSVLSNLVKTGDVLHCSSLSGPNVFEFECDVDLANMVGSLSIIGPGGSNPYSGVLDASVSGGQFTAVPEPSGAILFVAVLVTVIACRLPRGWDTER